MNAKKCIKPLKMWIDGKCFSINNLKMTNNRNTLFSSIEDIYQLGCTNCNSNQDDNIIKHFDKEPFPYSSIFHLPTYYYYKLGEHHKDIRDLASITNTTITIPKKFEKNKDIKITGNLEENVKNARSGLIFLATKIREGRALQFLGIPLLDEELKNNFDAFKASVLEEKISGVEESIFQKKEKLHLTIMILSLEDDLEKNEAIKTLFSCKNEIIKFKSPLKIKISGLNCMDENPEKSNVLYANAEILNEIEPNSLQKVVNSVSNYFYEKGFAHRYAENVKLHVTVINTKYRKQDIKSPRKKWVKRQPID